MKITAETLRRDRERRQDERWALADQYRKAASELSDLNHRKYHDVINHLLAEAKRWDR